MKTHLLLALCGLVFLGSCNTSSEKEAGNNITINLDKKETVSANLFIDSIGYVKLETLDENLISTIKKILIDEEKIYILDDRSGVFVFNRAGKFQYSIARIGRGPEEYIKADNIFLNQTTQIIGIIDLQNQKIQHYNTVDGSFLYSKKLERFVYSIFPITNDLFLSDLPCNLDGKSKTFGTFLLDSDYKMKEYLLAYEGDYPTFGQDLGSISELESGKYAIYSQVENTVYHFDPSFGMEKKYVFNINGKDSISSRRGIASTSLSKEEMLKLSYVFLYKETNKSILLCIPDNKGMIAFVAYLKEDNKVIVIKEFKEKPILISPVLTDSPNVLFGIIDDSHKEAMEKMDATAKQEIDANLLNLLEQSNEFENPILQILYLKH